MDKKTYTDSALSGAIADFFRSYKRDGRYVYIDMIDRMMPDGATSITVDYADFWDEPGITDEFKTDPDRILKAFSRAAKETLQTRFPDYAKMNACKIRVRIVNYPLVRHVSKINSDVSGMFVAVRAMVVGMSAVESIAEEAVYVCPDQHPTKAAAEANHTMAVPATCSDPSCGHRGLELVAAACRFVDCQLLQLQDLPGEVPAGRPQKVLSVFVSGDMVDSVGMGEMVEVCGVIRPEPSGEIDLGVPVRTYRHRMHTNSITRL